MEPRWVICRSRLDVKVTAGGTRLQAGGLPLSGTEVSVDLADVVSLLHCGILEAGRLMGCIVSHPLCSQVPLSQHSTLSTEPLQAHA